MTQRLRLIDDDTLLEMYDAARADQNAEECEAIVGELIWRGIEVRPCSSATPGGSKPDEEPAPSDDKKPPSFTLRGH